MLNSSFNNIIERIFRQNGGWFRLKGELSVYYWPRVAGPEIAGKVKAIRYYNGFLYLQTENPALAHQVSLFSLEIVKRFQKVLGKGVIKGIKIKIGPVALEQREHALPKKDYPLTEREEKLIHDCADKLEDPDLAEHFSKLIQAFYQNQKQVLAEGGHRCSSCQTVISGEYLYCPSCQIKL
ncbi:MAG: DciA family protein [Bacteroidota bacterium]